MEDPDNIGGPYYTLREIFSSYEVASPTPFPDSFHTCGKSTNICSCIY